MSRAVSLLILLLAAVLEAGGDAFVRSGLYAAGGLRRGALFLAGGVVLFGYGLIVNAPPWDFGRLLGLYVVFFFVVAQLISWLVFQRPPGPSVVLGGAFIVAGGLIISFAAR
jgi:small multidrug resistance family-3 protein